MKKNIILLGTLLISGFALSQVGVNTATPQATFDIVGASADTAKTDGLIAPRLKGSELKAKDGLYAAAQTGAIVYVTEALASTGTTTKTANVTAVGYFYFDGAVWQKIAYGSFTEADGVIGNEVLNATTNGGLTRAGSGTALSPYTLGLTSGTANGQVMTWNGTAWNPAAVSFTETDGVIGNEVLNATTNGGLTRAGSGTAASPYTLGLTSGTANGQVMTWNGTAWNPAAVSFTETDGVIGNEVLNATTNGGLTRAGSGTAASPYTLGLTSGTTNGQVMTWNGTTWNPASALNIYNADGTLTGARILTQNGYNLSFQGVQRTQFSNTAGIGIQQDSGTGTRSSIGLSNGGAYQLWIYTDTNNAAQINANGNSTSLSIGTNNTANPSGIDFKTCTGGGAVGTQRAQIDPDGKFNIINTLSVGYSSQQTFTGAQKLKVNGSIVTTGATYPDYVFEDYYHKSSTIKPSYKFTSLYDTEKFIKENKHLPGVTSISELERTGEGYSFNISDLSVQSLEKIEELYLHTIEQQKQIDEQKANIASLLKITEMLQAEIETLKKQ